MIVITVVSSFASRFFSSNFSSCKCSSSSAHVCTCLMCAFNFALGCPFDGAFLFLLLFTPVCEVAVNGVDTAAVAVNVVDTAAVAVNGVDTAVVVSVNGVEAAIVSVVEAGVESVLKNC